MSKHTIPTELNIAPRGKSWLNGQLIDGEHGHPTRQSMENAERAAFEKWARFFGTWDVERDDDPNFSTTGYTDITVNVAWLAWQARAALAATPAGSAVQCTCPSGDGSLQWPCPAHPPKASNLAAPAGAAKPAPITFMTEDGARDWAWDKVREEVGTQSWTAGESFNFHGFYLWGWNYRAQYELQRTATRSAVMQEILSATPAATAPVLLPEPDFWVRPGATIHPDRGWQCWSNDGTATGAFHADTVRALLAQKIAIMPKGESAAAQLRAMATNYPTGHSWDKLDAKACIHGALEIDALRAQLATATGLPAQAVEQAPVLYVSKGQLASLRDPDGPESFNAGRYLPARITPAGKFTTPLFAEPQVQVDARDDSALLDAMERHRIAVVPEYEGPWDAEVYNDEEKSNHRGSGSTPREAIRAAIAAQTAQQGGSA